jgi:hypothetical protein
VFVIVAILSLGNHLTNTSLSHPLSVSLIHLSPQLSTLLLGSINLTVGLLLLSVLPIHSSLISTAQAVEMV